MDVFEVNVRRLQVKVKVLLIMDVATQLKVARELFRYPSNESRAETGEQAKMALWDSWLQHFPKPKWWIADSARASRAGRSAKQALKKAWASS